MISRLYEHTAENNEHKIEKRCYSAGTKGGERAQVAQSGRNSSRTALAKQAMVMFMIAVMLTAPNDTTATGPPTTVRQVARTRLRAAQLTSMGEWWWRRPGQDVWRYETECRPAWADQEQKWWRWRDTEQLEVSTNIARGDEIGGSIRTTKRLEGSIPAMIVANKEERVPSRLATDPDGRSQGGSRMEHGGNKEGRQYRGESWEWSARIIQCFQPFTMAVMWMYMIIMAVYQKQYRCCCWPQGE